MFGANITGSQSRDTKAMGLIDKHNASSGPSICWLAKDDTLKSRTLKGVWPEQQNYPAGYRMWEISWLDSTILFKMDGKDYHPHDSLVSDFPSDGLPIEFSLQTSIAPYESNMILDWVAVRNCTINEPKVEPRVVIVQLGSDGEIRVNP
jgi:hypothetical protein